MDEKTAFRSIEDKAMKGRLAFLYRHETAAHAIRSVFSRVFSYTFARWNAHLLKWENGSVPIGSRVFGSKYMTVHSCFRTAGKVWIEAVAEYAGQQFSPEIEIGPNFTASMNLHITAINRVEIGADCLFGSNVFISDHGHGSYRNGHEVQSSPDSSPSDRSLVSHGRVRIGDRCWLGDNVAVLQGVTIGNGAVVGANSVVTKDVPSNSIAAGSPAVVLRRFDVESSSWVRMNS